MNNYIHIVYCPFTGVGLLGYRGDKWFKNRIEIFSDYTLKSLSNQTDQNFVLWLSFRPEEETNPLMITLELSLKLAGLPYIMTFDGLMYHDDKFSPGLTARTVNAARVMRRCWRLGVWSELIPSLRDIVNDKNKTLLGRLRRSLTKFPSHWSRANLIYLTRVDSDDMLDTNYIEYTHSVSDVPDVFVCKTGTVYNTTTQELAEWNPSTNPPFHTIVFTGQSFFDPALHLGRYGSFKSHEDILKIFQRQTMMPSHSYCVTTHDPRNHISTIWNHPFRGIIYEKEWAKLFIKNFGL